MIKWRIQDNVKTLGYEFAIEHETKRMIRNGMGKHAAFEYALRLVESNIKGL